MNALLPSGPPHRRADVVHPGLQLAFEKMARSHDPVEDFNFHLDTRFVSRKDGELLEGIVFTDTYPLYSSEIDDEALTAHGFEIA
jgi:hypothetical protein